MLLLASADQAFGAHEWQLAGADATGVLLRYPRCGPAAALAAEATRRVGAEPLALRRRPGRGRPLDGGSEGRAPDPAD